jgi:hypothetical protein
VRWWRAHNLRPANVISLRIAHDRRHHPDAMMNFANGLGYIGVS